MHSPDINCFNACFIAHSKKKGMPYRCVENNVRNLNKTALRIQENGTEQVHLFHCVVLFQDIDSVAHIEWMFDEITTETVRQ